MLCSSNVKLYVSCQNQRYTYTDIRRGLSGSLSITGCYSNSTILNLKSRCLGTWDPYRHILASLVAGLGPQMARWSIARGFSVCYPNEKRDGFVWATVHAKNPAEPQVRDTLGQTLESMEIQYTELLHAFDQL